MLKFFLWLRYLHKKRIVFLSIAAVAFSVALLIIVDSLFVGYIEAMKKNESGEMGDIFLWIPADVGAQDGERFRQELCKLEQVLAAGPVSFGGGLLWLESGDVRDVITKGIEPLEEAGFINWKEKLVRQKPSDGQVSFEVPGYPEDIGCWVGINIIAEPNEQTDEYNLAEVKKLIGKEVVLTTATGAGKRKSVKMRISDIAVTETFFGDQTLYVPLKKLNSILYGADGSQHPLITKIKLKDGANPEFMKAIVLGFWQRFATEELGLPMEKAVRAGAATQQEQMGKYLSELYRQKRILLLIFGVICSVAILLVFCIFYMIVETRLKDIATIKSCGATSGTAVSIFIGFGGCIGLAGSALGILFGYIVTRNINTLEEWVRIIFGMKLWRSSSYILKMIPNEVDWPAVVPIVLAAVAGCVVGALIPAIVAARVEPVKILRYE